MNAKRIPASISKTSGNVQELREYFTNHTQNIVDLWVRKVQDQIPDYKNRPYEEIEKNARTIIQAVIDALQGNYVLTDTLVTNVALTRAQMGFKTSDVTKALFIGRHILWTMLSEYFSKQPDNLITYLKHIDDWFYYVIIIHSEAQYKFLITTIIQDHEESTISIDKNKLQNYLAQLKHVIQDSSDQLELP